MTEVRGQATCSGRVKLRRAARTSAAWTAGGADGPFNFFSNFFSSDSGEREGEGDRAALEQATTAQLARSLTARKLLSARWAKERLPAEVKRLEELKKASKHLQTGRHILLSYSMQMADPAVIARGKASQLKAAQAIAAARAA
jgi:hypothetical protein